MWYLIWYLWSVFSFYLFIQTATGDLAVKTWKERAVGAGLIALWPIYPLIALYDFYAKKRMEDV